MSAVDHVTVNISRLISAMFYYNLGRGKLESHSSDKISNIAIPIEPFLAANVPDN